jgi:hypothetical protein
MKKLALAIAALSFASAAYAACTVNSYYINGKYVTCTTCCYGGNCNTSCY